MIVSITSSLPTFKSVRFNEGLNVLLADTRPDATQRQTRNSAGKTSLVEIIHFLLGADCGTDSLFRTKALVDHTFEGEFVIAGKPIKVQRGGASPAKVYVVSGSEGRPALPIKVEKETERHFVSNTHWKAYLGHAMFGMPADPEGSAFDQSFTPSFRAMISYFARRRNSGALMHPEKNAEQQQRWDWQVNLSYLFGLDWQIPFEFNKVRTRERTLEELRKAAKGGALGDVVGTVAELRPQLAVAETKAQKLRGQLANFEVLDSYRELSRRAARAKADMQAISRSAVSLEETLEHLEEALAAEAAPEKSDLQKLYSAAGIELPGIALRRFEEVSRFYEFVVANRRAHLQNEINETRRALTDGENQLRTLDTERSGILKTLDGRGAFEDFIALQRELAQLEAEAATLGERYKAAVLLEGEATQLELDRVNLKQRLQADHQERKPALDKAILIVADAIAELYDDRAGGFVVDATDNGPEFKITIEGDRGGGISNMEVFCLDYALLQVVSDRYGGPGFLLHDSHLFDGVDERQVAIALRLGWQATAGRGRQYIVTMNSDIFDRLPLDDDIDRDKVVLKTRLSDETETGGLFGFRFD